MCARSIATIRREGLISKLSNVDIKIITDNSEDNSDTSGADQCDFDITGRIAFPLSPKVPDKNTIRIDSSREYRKHVSIPEKAKAERKILISKAFLVLATSDIHWLEDSCKLEELGSRSGAQFPTVYRHSCVCKRKIHRIHRLAGRFATSDTRARVRPGFINNGALFTRHSRTAISAMRSVAILIAFARWTPRLGRVYFRASVRECNARIARIAKSRRRRRRRSATFSLRSRKARRATSA